MIDYKLIEQRLEDALSKETKESLLEWLKNHETQNQEDQRSVNVDQRVMLNFAEVKKEFEEKFVLKAGAKITFTTFGGNKYLEEITDMDAMLNLRPEVIWEWIEQKLKEASKISA